MSPAEHMIENIILAMERGETPSRDINEPYCSCTFEEAYRMAQHIVYTLYNGFFPKNIDELLLANQEMDLQLNYLWGDCNEEDDWEDD